MRNRTGRALDQGELGGRGGEPGRHRSGGCPDRRPVLRPCHARPAGEARGDRLVRPHRGRPGCRRPPHGRGHCPRPGPALREALGDKTGITRYGDAAVPLDEACAWAVVDLSGRPYLVHEEPAMVSLIGTYDDADQAHLRVPGRLGADLPAHPRARRSQRPPYRGSPVQGPRPGAAPGRRDRSARHRRAVDEGCPVAMSSWWSLVLLALAGFFIGGVYSFAKTRRWVLVAGLGAAAVL